MTQQEKRFHMKVTWVTFLLSILVVCVHSYNVPLFTEETTNGIGGFLWGIEEFFSNDLGQIAVPGFFMISAYLFYRNLEWDKIVSKWKSRIRSIVIPYIIWNSLYYIIYAILTNVSLFKNTTNKEAVLFSLSGFLDAVVNFTYNPVFWYLYQLILLIFLAPLLYGILKNKYIGVIGISVVFILVMKQFELPYLNMDALLYYTVAAYSALHLRKFVELQKSPLAALAGLTIMGLAYYFNIKAEGLKIIQYVLLHRLLFPIGLWFFLDGIPLVRIKPWMENSFFLYAIHFLIARSINKIGFFLIPLNPIAGLILYMGIPIAVTIIAYFLAVFLKTYLITVWKLLSGNRG